MFTAASNKTAHGEVQTPQGLPVFIYAEQNLLLLFSSFFKRDRKYFSSLRFQTQPSKQLNICMERCFAIMSLINTASILQSPSEKQIVCLSKLVVTAFPAINIFCLWCIPLLSPQPLSIFRDCLVCTNALIPVD